MTPIPCAHSEESTSVDYDAQWAWRGRGGKGDGCRIACGHQPIPCASPCESGTGPGRDAVERHGIHDVKRANQPLRALVLTTPAHPPFIPPGTLWHGLATQGARWYRCAPTPLPNPGSHLGGGYTPPLNEIKATTVQRRIDHTALRGLNVSRQPPSIVTSITRPLAG